MCFLSTATSHTASNACLKELFSKVVLGGLETGVGWASTWQHVVRNLHGAHLHSALDFTVAATPVEVSDAVAFPYFVESISVYVA